MEFRGLLPPMITPFQHGRVDAGGIERLVEWCAPYLHGMVVAGSTGEGPSMPLDERKQTIEHFARAIGGRMVLIVGVAETSLDNIRTLMRFGDEVGAAGYLVPLPYYFRHTAETVTAFFGEIAGYTDREIVIYDNPNTTKTTLTIADYARVAALGPNLRHVKITDTALQKVSAAREQRGLTMLAGSDEVMHQQVLRGCEGAVTAIPQVFPAESRRWFDAARTGDPAMATRLFAGLMPFINEVMIGTDEYPAVIKWMLRHRGVIASDEVRPPLVSLDNVRRQVLEHVMALVDR